MKYFDFLFDFGFALRAKALFQDAEQGLFVFWFR